jgi:hypothetical protein
MAFSDSFEIRAGLAISLDFIGFAGRAQVARGLEENFQIVFHTSPTLFRVDSWYVVLSSEVMVVQEAVVPGLLKALERITSSFDKFFCALTLAALN